tara:strand:+ start:23034 stop:23549 length:516 start_codon:yes stop_codon:yes gene_type:complete
MYKLIFPELIRLLKHYLPKEDIDSISSINMELPITILKHKKSIQYNQLNGISIDTILDDNPFIFLHKIETLDFLISIDLLNRLENINLVIEKIGFIIASQGIFSFIYKRKDNRNYNAFSLQNTNSLKSCPIKDGVIQKHLINNNFYIQHEVEFPINQEKDCFMVLIIAQKK